MFDAIYMGIVLLFGEPAPHHINQPIIAQTEPFDGVWDYEISTTSALPTCRGFGSGSIAIEGGKFSGFIAHNQDSFRVKGEVINGKSEFKAIGNYDTGTFNVDFAGNKGLGTWKSRVAGCKGSIKLAR